MDPSATIYTTLVLRFYDLVVLVISNALAWRCSTRSSLSSRLPLHELHTKDSSAHLENRIQPRLLPRRRRVVSALSKKGLVTLCDLNPNTLAYSKSRLASANYSYLGTGSVEMRQHTVLQPLPRGMRGKYDCVALSYLLLRLPGSFPRKATDTFANVAPRWRGMACCSGLRSWATVSRTTGLARA